MVRNKRQDINGLSKHEFMEGGIEGDQLAVLGKKGDSADESWVIHQDLGRDEWFHLYTYFSLLSFQNQRHSP